MNRIMRKAAVLILLVGLIGFGVAVVSAQDDLTGVEWQWTSMTDNTTGATTTVPDPSLYTITFAEDGTLSGRADCNNFAGSYTQENNGVQITLGPTTLVACPEGSLETVFRQTLDSVEAGGPDGTGNLALETAGGAQRMVFQPAGGATAGVTEDAAAQDGGGGFLGLPWWAWLLLALLLLLLLWWLFGRRQPIAQPEPPAARRTVTEEPPVAPIAAPPPPVVDVVPEAEARVYTPEPAAAMPDDLKRIEGIGPRIEGILNNAGVSTFAALSAMTVEQLRNILNAADLRGSFGDPSSWPAQATLAAEGKWDELRMMQENLKGGR